MNDVPENTREIQKIPRNKGGRFAKGISGNPAGKPKGTLHKATQAAMVLLDGEAEQLTRKAVELALNGDVTALRICMDRIAPSLKSTAPMINLDIPPPDNLTDTAKAFVYGASNGDIAPDIAAQMVSAVASVARVEEMEHIKQRLESLERAIKDQK